MYKKIPVFLRTTKDLKPSQIYFRILLVAKKNLRRLAKLKSHTILERGPFFPIMIKFAPEELASLEKADSALNGEFEFLNKGVKYEVVDWSCPDNSRLWRFNLHYCSVVKDFATKFLLTKDKKYLNGFENHIKSWISSNPAPRGDGWHPYTISLRVTNWILGFSKVSSEFNREFVILFHQSIQEQLIFLKKNLEFDIRGNHLLENIKALIIGGLFLGKDGPGQVFFTKGLRLLGGQLSEQILEDGGHFERSPMYHCIVLEDLLIIYEALFNSGVQPSESLNSSISKMVKFLHEILLSDNQYPLLNDSAYGISLLPKSLIRWAQDLGFILDSKIENINLMKESGYARIVSKNGDVIVSDLGETCPKFLPGHAHADTLSFIWNLGDGTPLFIDPGVYEYTKGEWRDYFRSTKAHNSLTVDSYNSTEIWGSFRAGRKAKVIDSDIKDYETYYHVYGEHDGFKFLPGKPLHRRELFFFMGNVLLVIDSLNGSGIHEIDSFLHCYPGWDTKIDVNHIELTNPNRRFILKFIPFENGFVSIHTGESEPILGWYSEEFGKKIPTTSIIYSLTKEIPVRIGFVCYPDSMNVNLETTDLGVSLLLNGNRYRIISDPNIFPVLREVTNENCISQS